MSRATSYASYSTSRAFLAVCRSLGVALRYPVCKFVSPYVAPGLPLVHTCNWSHSSLCLVLQRGYMVRESVIRTHSKSAHTALQGTKSARACPPCCTPPTPCSINALSISMLHTRRHESCSTSLTGEEKTMWGAFVRMKRVCYMSGPEPCNKQTPMSL